MIIPVGVNYAARRYPVVTFTLIGINVVLFLSELILGWTCAPDFPEWVFNNLWLAPASAHWYSYLTTLFVHGGLFHLVGNMIYLFLFGSCVEDIIGRWKFAVFYLLGGLCADFAYIAATPAHFASEIPLGGASGAVSACIGGFLVLLPKTEIEFKYFFWFLRPFAGGFELKAWIVIIFWFLEDLASALLVHASGMPGGVAFAAHVGGTCLGFGLLLALRKWIRAGTEEEEEFRVATVRIKEPGTIYLSEAGNQLGPYTPTQVKQMIDLGAVSGEAFFWQEGMAEWRNISEFTLFSFGPFGA